MNDLTGITVKIEQSIRSRFAPERAECPGAGHQVVEVTGVKPGSRRPALQIDFTSQITNVKALPLTELRCTWRHHHPQLVVPDHLPRDLLVRSIAWQLQVKDQGDVDSTVARQLDRMGKQLARASELDVERETRLKPGTKLIREWRGRTIWVLVLEDGYLFEDRRYASLSHIASAITGTRWSGPRFFGLKQRKRATTGSSDV
jgi:hypothetical protein